MSAPLRVLVDGAPLHAGWPLDRGLQYGDGLFETMRVRDGAIRFEADHRARLAAGCTRLAIAADLDAVWREAGAVAAEQGEAILRLQLTRGEALARGYTPTGRERFRSILAVFAPPGDDELPERLAVVSLTQQLGENPQLAGLKHCNRLEQVLARQAMAGSGAFEGLMASSSGVLISGTMSNVFLEIEGELMTPAVDRSGVAGVMRTAVLREAAADGVPVRVAALPLEAAQHCSSLYLSNARMGLVRAHLLDGRPLAASSRMDRLAARVAAE